MGLSLTAEEKEFQASVRRCFETEVTAEYRRARLEAPKITDEKLWDKFKEFGLIDLFLDKEIGTFSMLSVVAEEAGRSLIPEAVSERLFFGAFLQKSAVFISGGICNEKGAALCLGGEAAESLMLLKGDQASLVTKGKPVKILDSLLSAVVAEWRESIIPVPKNTLFSYRLLKVSEMYGAAAKVVEMTVEYLKTRKQYGVPIGGFQAVQHQLAEAFVSLETLRAITRFAIWAHENDPSQFQLAALSALQHAQQVGSEIIETCLQLHGGIGFTWEFDLHLYLRRVKLIEQIIKISDQEVWLLCSVAS